MQSIKYLFHLIALSSFISIILIGFVLDESPEFWEHGYETGIVLFSLSTSFLAAYFFFFMDIFVPSKIKKNQLTKRLVLPLNRILGRMNASMECIKELSGLEYAEFKTLKNKGNNDNFNFDFEKKEAPRVKTDLETNFSYFEYFYDNKLDIDFYVKRVNSLPELDFEIQLLMDKIIYCDFHEILQSINNVKGRFGKVSYNPDMLIETFEEYVELLFELKNMMSKQKIKITVDCKNLK